MHYESVLGFDARRSGGVLRTERCSVKGVLLEITDGKMYVLPYSTVPVSRLASFGNGSIQRYCLSRRSPSVEASQSVLMHPYCREGPSTHLRSPSRCKFHPVAAFPSVRLVGDALDVGGSRMRPLVEEQTSPCGIFGVLLRSWI
jgi:hypothetical protein